MEELQRNISNYRRWVVNHPTRAAELETSVKWGSYLLAGCFQNSSLLYEIVYAGSRLFEMYNDFLLCRKYPLLSEGEINRVTVLLTVIENVEVLIEVAAVQLWGEVGRWAVVSIIQLIKAIWRLFLLIRKRMSFICSPPIKAVNRKKALSTLQMNSSNMNGFVQSETNDIVRLPRSGTLMRTLEGAPPPHLRTFSPPKDPTRIFKRKPYPTQLGPVNQIAAEVLHIVRPLSHLGSMYFFGTKSWLPYCLSLGIDLTSLHLHSLSPLSKEEKRELGRRRLSLLYYLVRNPAFHAVTHNRINQFLLATGNKIPLARFICQPLLEYVPEWQKIYSYTWS